MRLLHVESSRVITRLVKHEIYQLMPLTIDTAETKSQTLELLTQNASDYDLAVVCLSLEDSPHGEIVQTVLEYQIPTIIFSGTFDETAREKFLNQSGVVEYVVKENMGSLKYLAQLVRRLLRNKSIKVMTVDDSRAMRTHVSCLLNQYQFQVIEAENGQQALDLLAENPDIKLIVTDYHMAPIDGLELTRRIREEIGREELAIIALSAVEQGTLSARFIKSGANDFLTKPFLPEEFFCRITQNIDLIEKTRELIDAATKDFLTKLYNRRFFFEKGIQKLEKARANGQNYALAMLDIDHFKSVNDTFGHDVGDEVLKGVSNILSVCARKGDLVARLGGEEFAILMTDIEAAELSGLFENMRSTIESRRYASLKDREYVTSSFGVCLNGEGDLDQLVKEADELLYQSKTSGRNRVSFKGI